jgi:hypothetical protein
MKQVEIEPIGTNRDYRGTLEEIEGLMHARRSTLKVIGSRCLSRSSRPGMPSTIPWICPPSKAPGRGCHGYRH